MLKIHQTCPKVFAGSCPLYYSCQHHFVINYLFGVFLKLSDPKILYESQDNLYCLLNAKCQFIMPKRVKSHSASKSKKAKEMLASNRRHSIPRSCKNLSFLDLNTDLLSMQSEGEKVVMNSTQVKITSVEKKKKKVKEEVISKSSDEELDVVYDFKEEKKNKIYEVITVMSDDEVPNEVSYERLYAENPEDRVVDPESLKPIIQKFEGNRSVEKEVPPIKISLRKECIIPKEQIVKPQNYSLNNVRHQDNKAKVAESDDEIECLAVIDAKAKVESRKENVEVICLSSDSEIESNTLGCESVPSIGLGVSNDFNWSLEHFLNHSALPTSRSKNTMGFADYRVYRPSPVKANTKDYTLNPVSDWETSSNSKYSEACSLTPLNSPVMLTNDESSLPSQSAPGNRLNAERCSFDDDDDDDDGCSTSSMESRFEEENKIYWKGKSYIVLIYLENLWFKC